MRAKLSLILVGSFVGSLLAACQVGPRDADESTPNGLGGGDQSPQTAGTWDPIDPDAGTSGGAETTDGGNSGASGPALDVAGSGGIDPDGSAGCRDVEFLFVVDNSGSMGDEQQNLVASFGGFISTIQETVGAQSYRVMVVETGLQDDYEELIECHEDCADPDEEDCDVPGMGDVACDALPAVPTCEVALGAGRVNQTGLPAVSCGGTSSGRFLDASQPNLAQTFECLALVGTDGDGSEQPITAMLNAVTQQAAPSQCNDGFLGDDSILVVTLITDEEEELASAVQSWHDELVAAKGGNESAVVVLGLVSDAGTPDAQCSAPDMTTGQGAEPSPRLRDFVSSFGERGFLGSVCAPSYNEFFEEAVDVIDFACNEFDPEG